MIILWIVSGWGVLHVSAQETNTMERQVDTCSVENQKVVQSEKPADIEKQNFTYSKLYQMTFVGAPLIVTGMIMKGEDTHFRCLRNDYMQQFHRPFDNYTQFLPAAVMLGMKVAGVCFYDRHNACQGIWISESVDWDRILYHSIRYRLDAYGE